MFSLTDTLKGQKTHKEDIMTEALKIPTCSVPQEAGNTDAWFKSDDTNKLHAVHGMHQSVAAKYSPVHLESRKTPGDLSVPVNRKALLR